jgi:GNAT superfamily N-acetyltransferase
MLDDNSPRRATDQDAPLVTRILVDAFQDDAMWGPWAFPGPERRRENREAVFRVLVEGALRYPHVWLAAGDAAAAVWIPPDGTELSAAQEEEIDDVLRGSLGDRTEAVLHAFELFETARPAAPHYYLTLLGTDPRRAGRGVGRALLQSNLDRIDAAGAASYLEAADELVPFYASFGFHVTSRFALDQGPTVNGMWRDARSLSRR